MLLWSMHWSFNQIWRWAWVYLWACENKWSEMGNIWGKNSFPFQDQIKIMIQNFGRSINISLGLILKIMTHKQFFFLYLCLTECISVFKERHLLTFYAPLRCYNCLYNHHTPKHNSFMFCCLMQTFPIKNDTSVVPINCNRRQRTYFL